MDHLDALIAIAHLRLRLILVERNPHLLNEAFDMEIKRPMELAGLKSRLARAQKQELDIAITGRRYDAVQDAIDDLHNTARAHVGHLEVHKAELQSTIERMVGASNGDPSDGQVDGQKSDGADGVGQIISSKTA